MKKRFGKIVLYIAMLLLLFWAVFFLTSPDVQERVPTSGRMDLTDVDLGENLVEIATRHWAYYPGVLYGPEDFEGDSPEEALYGTPAQTSEYGTYRLVLALRPDQICAVSGRSPNLSQRLFIDGDLAGEVGRPGESREETIPRTKTYEYFFITQGSETELIFQIANFHHREGGKNTPLLLAHPSVLSRYRALEFIRSNIVLGCVLTVSLYFLGMFIFFPGRKYFLFLALAAFVTALRMPVIGEKHIMELFPELDWFFSIRLEYICLLLFVVSLLLYSHYLYPGMLHRWLVGAILLLSLAFLGIVVLCDSTVFTRVQPYYAVVWVVASLATLWGLIRMVPHRAHRNTHTLLIFCGFVTFFATALYDEVRYLFIDHVRLENTLITGMLVCLYMNMIALTLEFSEKEKEIGESRVSILLSQLQPHFLYNILVVIGQLCDTAPQEAKRTVLEFSGFLRNNLDSLFSSQLVPIEKEVEHVTTYLALEKRRFGERIRVEWDVQCTSFALPALTLQPLVENAVRYGVTKRKEGGTVTIRTREEDRQFLITISDDGVGFDPGEAKQDGRSHRGIENVRSRMAAMCQGRLSIHSSVGGGTEVTLSLPKKTTRIEKK